MAYLFKKITPVPKAKEFIDITLSQTQRKTPTVIHPQVAISRTRSFYTRKVKYTAQTFHDRLQTILTEFPKVDDIHPFYGDLMNVLYDKSHFKLALGQLNTACHLIDRIGAEYVKLLKYADTPYRAKALKIAALGRMATIMKKQGPSLSYLEEVRRHLARIPSIDPTTRTLIIAGFPNVGKSSFINSISRANVDVQSYAFTTQSLLVGHSEYKDIQWQFIDTPGILDHALEERNTIEMQSVIAMAHLRAAILFVIDLSELCGYTVAEQISLFNSIKPLFVNKPLFLVINKIDVATLDSISADNRALVEALLRENPNVTLLSMSTQTGEGVIQARNTACDALLEQRVQTKMQSKKTISALNRLHVAMPKPRDGHARPAIIPPGAVPGGVKANANGVANGSNGFSAMAITNAAIGARRKTERDLQEEAGGPGKYIVDLRKYYELENEDWKYDIIPEIIDGKNIADFIDPDIDAKLQALEEEEANRVAAEHLHTPFIEEELTAEEQLALGAMEAKKHLVMWEAASKKSKNHPHLPRNQIRDLSAPLETVIGPSGRRTMRRRADIAAMEAEQQGDEEDMDMEGGRSGTRTKLNRSQRRAVKYKSSEKKFSQSVVRERVAKRSRSEMSRSKTPARDVAGLQSEKMRDKAEKMSRKKQKIFKNMVRDGLTDRREFASKPKHLMSGKRGIGKTDRR